MNIFNNCSYLLSEPVFFILLMISFSNAWCAVLVADFISSDKKHIRVLVC